MAPLSSIEGIGPPPQHPRPNFFSLPALPDGYPALPLSPAAESLILLANSAGAG